MARLTLFRYRRYYKNILAVYDAFKSSEQRTLHPIELSRLTGLHMLDIVRAMNNAPEIFFKVPASATTKYALRLTIANQEREIVEKLIQRRTNYETFFFWALIVILILAVVTLILGGGYPFIERMLEQIGNSK